MPTRAVVFDLYGTLVDEAPKATWQAMQDELADTLGIDRDTFARLWLETYDLRSTGPFPTSLEELCGRAGAELDSERLGRVLELRREYMRDQLVPRPDAEQTLTELRGRGLELGLVTECSDGVPDLWPETRLAPHFAAQVYTCEVGVRKPARVLYDLVCERLDAEHAECVYVGDGGGYELAGAAELGMRPILIVAPHAEWLHPEAEDWTGARVSSLRELLALI
jgi:putative hydrolase of the HAD superfamily